MLFRRSKTLSCSIGKGQFYWDWKVRILQELSSTKLRLPYGHWSKMDAKWSEPVLHQQFQDEACCNLRHRLNVDGYHYERPQQHSLQKQTWLLRWIHSSVSSIIRSFRMDGHHHHCKWLEPKDIENNYSYATPVDPEFVKVNLSHLSSLWWLTCSSNLLTMRRVMALCNTVM